MNHVLIEKANALVGNKPSLDDMLASFTDSSIDLGTRWEAYKLLVDNDVLTGVYNSSDGMIDCLTNATNPKNRYSVYDDFYIERHETRKFTEMFEYVEEWIEGEEVMAPTPESLMVWQEAILASGCAFFKYDW